MKIDNFNADLDLLENLSKKISDLIYNDDFEQIPVIDAQRRAIIKKIVNNNRHKVKIKKRIRDVYENNMENIRITEAKLKKLSENRNKYSNRLRAYYFNK